MKKIAVIGGGAAGFFFAVNLAKSSPGVSIEIFEKTSKILSKVKVSGGGRCNVTNAISSPIKLAENYPRGKNFLKRIFNRFSSSHMVEWLRNEGVDVKTEPDNRIFPVTDNSQTIMDCFTGIAEKKGISIHLNTSIYSLEKRDTYFILNGTLHFDFVFVGTGGSPKPDAYTIISNGLHEVIPPVPSLFTFNIPNNPLKGLEGISVQEVKIKINKFTLQSSGALLVTHWGLSGPAVLRLSAWGAEIFSNCNYNFSMSINFVPSLNQEQVKNGILEYKANNKNKLIFSHRLFELPSRMWERLCEISEIDKSLKWLDIPKQNLNKLVENISNFSLQVNGKTTFREEFVTCGGVNLEEIKDNLESKNVPGLYFGGEVLNIDGITGGFNFQAAWTTSWIAAADIAEKIKEIQSEN